MKPNLYWTWGGRQWLNWKILMVNMLFRQNNDNNRLIAVVILVTVCNCICDAI